MVTPPATPINTKISARARGITTVRGPKSPMHSPSPASPKEGQLRASATIGAGLPGPEGSSVFSSTISSSGGSNVFDPNDKGGESNNVRVMTRVRPFNKREKEIQEQAGGPLKPCISMRDNVVSIIDPETEEAKDAFEFDECFWTMPSDQGYTTKPFADQKYVYDRSGFLAMRAAFDGYNACIFAYGQTGSGKTYSMLGSRDDPGISPRLVDDLFQEIDNLSKTNPGKKIEVDCTFMEIYNEKVRDLFNKKHKEGEYEPAKVRLHPQKGVYVEGLSRKTASTAAQAKFFIEHGTKERAMAETKMNAHSSRSHAIFQIQTTQKDTTTGIVRTSTINLVDLAGSERIKHSGVTGDALKEAQNINQSLSTLRKVIDTLIDNSKLKPGSKNRHIPPFRESVLTWVLSDSLGGNSKTMMMTAISPHIVNVEETISTLRYALRAKAIVCSAKVNEEKSSALVSSMKDEIRKLQAQLASGGGGGGMSDEIRKEIEEREAEMVNLEESFKRKEEEMNKQLDMQLEQSENLKVAINQRKHQHFADVFRNAFSTKRHHQEVTNLKALLEGKTKQAEDLQNQTGYLEKEMAALKKRYEEEISSSKQEISSLQKVLSEKEGIIHETNQKLQKERDTVSELERKITTVQHAKRDVERTNQQITSELNEFKLSLEKEKVEIQRAREKDDQLRREMAEARENMRRRKEAWAASKATAS